MFGQDTDKPFDASEHNPVDHHRTVFFTVLAGVGQVEPLGHLAIRRAQSALLEIRPPSAPARRAASGDLLQKKKPSPIGLAA